MTRYDVALVAGDDPAGLPARVFGRHETHKAALLDASDLADTSAISDLLTDQPPPQPFRVALRTVRVAHDLDGGTVTKAVWIAPTPMA